MGRKAKAKAQPHARDADGLAVAPGKRRAIYGADGRARAPKSRRQPSSTDDSRQTHLQLTDAVLRVAQHEMEAERSAADAAPSHDATAAVSDVAHSEEPDAVSTVGVVAATQLHNLSPLEESSEVACSIQSAPPQSDAQTSTTFIEELNDLWDLTHPPPPDTHASPSTQQRQLKQSPSSPAKPSSSLRVEDGGIPLVENVVDVNKWDRHMADELSRLLFSSTDVTPLQHVRTILQESTWSGAFLALKHRSSLSAA